MCGMVLSIMAETLHSPEETQKTFTELTNDALALGNSGHETDQADGELQAFVAARSIVDLPAADASEPIATEVQENTKPEDDAQPNFKKRRIVVGAAGLVAGAAVAGVASLVPQAVDALAELHSNSGPTFSEESTTHFTQPGDTLWGIADQIEGVHDLKDKQVAVEYVENHPANIDVLEDGLQPGDTITVPVSVE